MANSVGTDFGFFGFISGHRTISGKLFAAIPVTQVFHRFYCTSFCLEAIIAFYTVYGNCVYFRPVDGYSFTVSSGDDS